MRPPSTIPTCNLLVKFHLYPCIRSTRIILSFQPPLSFPPSSLPLPLPSLCRIEAGDTREIHKNVEAQKEEEEREATLEKLRMRDARASERNFFEHTEVKGGKGGGREGEVECYFFSSFLHFSPLHDQAPLLLRIINSSSSYRLITPFYRWSPCLPTSFDS